MSTQAITSTNNLHDLWMGSEKNQYTVWQILGIWALIALPMALLTGCMKNDLWSRISKAQAAKRLELEKGYWVIAARVYCTLLMIAAVAFIWFLNYWNLLGWRY